MGAAQLAFPPPRTQEVRPTNLPAGGPTLVGRDHDVERVRAAFLTEGDRLLTLTGRGGAGKTSLALVAAAVLLDEHAGGVWLVRLATTETPEAVVPAIATAIGADRDVGVTPAEAVVARLRERGPTLVVLDNLEHLLGAAAELAALLDALPDLRLLVTSQAPLRLAAERCLPLDALDEHAALELMTRTAERRGARLDARGSDRDALLEIVGLLDGLPLAIELAAARLALLSPLQLRDRLRASPDILADSGPDRLERHRSLRATVDWSLGLLEDEPRALFVRMGAFVGPAELEDLEAVASEDGLGVLEALARLLDVALVRRVERGDGRVRFGLPEALRQIALELLDASPDGERWRRAHARRQCEIACAARPLGVSGEVYRAAMAADADADAALRWAREAGDPVAGQLGVARAMLLGDIGRLREALSILAPLLASPTGNAGVDGWARVAHAAVLLVLDEHDECLAECERAMALTDDPIVHEHAMAVRAWIHTARGEHEEAIRDMERARARARSPARPRPPVHDPDPRSTGTLVRRPARPGRRGARRGSPGRRAGGGSHAHARGDGGGRPRDAVGPAARGARPLRAVAGDRPGARRRDPGPLRPPGRGHRSRRRRRRRGLPLRRGPGGGAGGRDRRPRSVHRRPPAGRPAAARGGGAGGCRARGGAQGARLRSGSRRTGGARVRAGA